MSIKHFKNIQYLYGKNAYIQMPNKIFRKLSKNIKNKNGSTNIMQSSFAYAYLVSIGFLYKYAHFVDLNNESYLQNSNIKEMLGYSRTTKSIDNIIKKNGVLESIGLIKTTKDFPVSVVYSNDEYNKMKIRDFKTLNMLDKDNDLYKKVRSIVKNRNFEIKEPTFMFEYDGCAGTLYDYSNSHKVTISEFIEIISDPQLDNIDLMLYFYFKSKCKNYKNNKRSLSLSEITNEIGIGKDAFFSHLKIAENKNMIFVNHKGWFNGVSGEKNEYQFIGV